MSRLLKFTPTLETMIVNVDHVVPEEVGHRLLYTIHGDRLAAPTTRIIVSTFSDWRAALCRESARVKKPVQIQFRNYGHSDRRLVEVEWAQ